MENTHFKEAHPTIHNINTYTNIIHTIYSPKRLKDAIMSFKSYKAAGPDTLKLIIIQIAWHKICDFVRGLMIKSHELQQVPKPWQESNGYSCINQAELTTTNL